MLLELAKFLWGQPTALTLTELCAGVKEGYTHIATVRLF